MSDLLKRTTTARLYQYLTKKQIGPLIADLEDIEREYLFRVEEYTACWFRQKLFHHK
jgi:hypothetical protein